MSVSTGTYNASSDGLGSPTAKITTGVVDLANVNATINNQINSNTTAPPNTTAAPTTPAPLVPDTNVTILNASITRTECGRKQLCAAQPSGCDPSNGTCFFLGAQALGGQNFMFDLAGESDGYIAATLSRNTQGVNDTTYICANNNGVVKFFSALLNNGKLTRTPLKVNNVRGKVSGKNIQCQFAATVPDSTSTTTRADTSTTSFSMSVSTGTYNASSDGLGSPTAKITTGVVDLANVNATINNQINSNTTAPPNTTAAPTTPAPLVPDTNVTILNASITRTECGRKQLCAAQPSGCDPSNGTCFFLGAQALGGQNFMFDLAGESDGYIAATLSRNTQGVNDTTYICANNNGVVKFFSALLNNGKLTRTPLKVNNVRGKVSGKNIQCQFAATVPDSTSTTTRADTSTTSFSMSVSTGTYNASSDGLGSPTAKITTGVVDLANVNATINNQINSNTTAPPNTTAAPTTPAPLVPDTNVTILNASITRTECGRKQLCAAQPSGCDPSNGTCFFLGAQPQGGQNFMFDLAGESDGYIAATLSRNTQGVNDTTYICANNNGVVKFFSALLNNGKLTRTPLKVNNVRGKVSGKNIQCQFAATVPDSTSTTTRADTSTTSFSMSVSTGTYNASSDGLGSPTAKITTGVVDLANVNATINNQINSNTTAPPNTTAAPTTPAPLVPDTNVTILNASITRTECGRKQLCAAQPSGCDPSNGTCFFLGAQALGGQNFMFDLAGESDGYIAATLSRNTQGVNDTTYICANNNGVVKFFSALLNNGKLTRTPLKVNNVRGKVSGKNIQCQFAATVPDSTSTTTRADTSTTSFSMSVSTGTYNASSDGLGSPTAKITTGVVDLANVNATINNQINSNTTAPPNTTAAPTTPAPLVPDTNVTILNASITRTECGRKQLCAAQPSGCDPSNGTCFFLGAQALGGQNFMFDLAGESDGYIAATLSRNTQGVNDTTYICANNNGVVKFFSALLNNGKLTRTPLKVNNVRGKVSGKNIQCQFAATVPDSTSTTTRADTSTTSFSMSVSTGTYNASSDGLGSPTAKITTGVVDLANVNATINNQINSNTTTAPPNTTAAPPNTTAAPTTPAPLVPDTNVTILNASITRTECGRKQLCAAQPSGCDPSNGTCFFLGAQALGGQNFMFDLAGESDGYIAATLSRNTQGVNDTTYICANNNGVVKFFSALLNNGKLTRTTLKVNTVRGKVSGNKIQCQFAATVPDSTSTTTRADTSTTSFSMSVSTGTYNASSDDLGSPTAKITTGVVDLANVNATTDNQINSTTTTAPSNTTTAAPSNTTTAPSNTTTAPSNTTAAPTTPAPLVPDSTVTTLNTSITKDNCSKTQLCVSQPSGCDPSSGTCFFLGAQQLGGQNFRFSLAGQSDGYVALTLSRNTTPGTNDTTYICANNNNVVKYISALLNNGKLNPTTLKVNNVKGKVSGKNIQCQFDATVPDSTSTTTRADTSTTNFAMVVSNGTYNAASDDLGSPVFQIRTNVVDLSNVTATITNLISSNSTNTTTTSAANAITIQQSLMQALLITVGILTLSWL
ncbi:mucin-5AC [Oreochromis niloticus]|uniref:mucin-5AC n=1 Tax=Oreochromis niloticus TaxID=8128 RepID=UPI000904FE4E|nr:mucin-5AC [Oreochromis niloticus]